MTDDTRSKASRATGAIDLDSVAGAASDPATAGESKRFSPRSPRAALEPERVPEPHRHSQRVRHPIIIAGNAIFTFVLIVALAGALAYVIGKQRIESAGPLENDKVVNIPRGLGVKEIGDLLQREGVIDQPGLVFFGGVKL